MLINIYCSSTFIHASLSKPVSNSIFYLLKKRCIFVRREFSFIFWKLISPFFSHNAAAFSFNAWLHPPTRNLLFLSQHFLNFPGNITPTIFTFQIQLAGIYFACLNIFSIWKFWSLGNFTFFIFSPPILISNVSTFSQFSWKFHTDQELTIPVSTFT